MAHARLHGVPHGCSTVAAMDCAHLQNGLGHTEPHAHVQSCCAPCHTWRSAVGLELRRLTMSAHPLAWLAAVAALATKHMVKGADSDQKRRAAARG